MDWKIPLVFLVCNALWLYAFTNIPDSTMSNRGYISVLSVAAFVTFAVERSTWNVLWAGLLVVLYSIHTVRYLPAFKDVESYTLQAYRETPYKPRVISNYALLIYNRGQLDEAAAIFIYLVKLKIPLSGDAARDLIAIKLQQLQSGDKRFTLEQLLKFCEEVVKKFPMAPELRTNYASVLTWAGKLYEALEQLDASLKLDGRSTPALRNRARLYWMLGEAELAKADAELSQEIDGRALTFR